MSGEVVGYQRRGRRVGSHDWNAWLPCSADAFNQIGANRTIGGFELESRALVLATEYAALQAKLDDVTKERDALRCALNPQQWTSEMSTAWHLNIPDLQKSFDELTNAALTDQGRAGEGES